MKMKRTFKRIVAGIVGVTMVAGIFFGETMNNITDVQADTRVFTKITDTYTPTGATDENIIQILEITTTDSVYHSMVDQNGPSRAINQKAELGYFMPYSANARGKCIAGYYAGNSQESPAYLGETSLGGRYGHPNSGDGDVSRYQELVWRNNQWEYGDWKEEQIPGEGTAAEKYERLITKFRDYGLVKPFGADSGWQTIVGEYPIYSKGATFSSSRNDTSTMAMNGSLVPGVYTYAEGGGYKLADGYVLNEYCEISTVSQNTVSENGIESTVDVYTPVEDIITTEADLPKTAEGNYYITKVEDGQGNLTFTETEAESTLNGRKQYYGYSRNTLYYAQGGADFSRSKNSGWFAEYVLGSYKKYGRTDLGYTVKAANQVTAQDILDADLVYISGTSAEFSANDLTEDAVKTLYESTVNEHKAIIMDFDGYNKNADTNYNKLAALLWQESQDDLMNGETGVVSYDSANKTVTLNLDKLEGDVYDDLKATMLTENQSFVNQTDGNFVVGNVYVYDHHMRDFVETKVRLDAEDSIANGDFNSAYNATVTNAGFNNVLQYIQTTNRNSMTGSMANEVTPAVVIQYILVSDGIPLTVMKNSLNILEIEPAPAYLYNPGRGTTDYADLPEDFQKNRDDFIENYLSSYYDTKEMKKYISFTSMTVAEFNGKNDDLIETYDIIYIGDQMIKTYGAKKDKNIFNKKSANSKPWHDDTLRYGGENGAAEKIDIPDYFDDNMDGMIYYNMGDYHTSVASGSNYMNGTINNEEIINNNALKLRYPGRDITKNKLTKLKEFLKANALVIVAEDLYGNHQINPTAVANSDNGRVDNSSNLYEFLMFGTGKVWSEQQGAYVDNTQEVTSGTEGASGAIAYANMVSAADIKMGIVDKASLNQYIAAQKLDLLISEAPVEYGYNTKTDSALSTVIDPDTVTYLKTKDEDGTRILKYVFSIADDPTLLPENTEGLTTQYICRLYIDINNDGKFSHTTEDISDIKVVDSAGNEPARNSDDNGDDHYLLQPGVQYTLTREVSDEYCGIIKWKLSVEAKGHSTIHASEQGYTMVKNETGQKKVVKILQLTHGNLNLMKNLYDERTALKNQIANGGNITHNKWGKYLVDLPDYELEIRTMTVSQFESDFTSKYNTAKAANSSLSAEDFALNTYFPSFEVKSPNVTTDSNNNKYDFTNEETVTGVNMLVLGFGDNFPGFNNYSTIAALRAFIEQGNPVLLAHDFLMFWPDKKQVRILRQAAGMDKYGATQKQVPVTGLTEVNNDTKTALLINRIKSDGTEATEGQGYMYSGLTFSRSDTDDKDKIALIEGTDKEVPYEPGTTRTTISKFTQGFSYDSMERFSKGGTNTFKGSWLSSDAAYGAYMGQENGFKASQNKIEKLNDGQITQYPYILPDNFVVQTTHSQYYELDLTSDADNDGESDVVVWYAMGTNVDGNGNRATSGNGCNKYDDEIGISVDPANGYYIYNKGNVTYTGAGHTSLQNAPDGEIQLFVNSLLASFETGNVEPTVGFFDSPENNAHEITSIIVPYDGNVTKPAEGTSGVDSGVTKKPDGEYQYKFVDPNNTSVSVDKVKDGTIVYFRVEDQNLVRGTKSISVRYLLETDLAAGEEFTTNRNVKRTVVGLELDENKTVNVVDISADIETYKVTNKVVATEAMARTGLTEENKPCIADIESGMTYAIYLPMDYLNDNASFTIYVEAQTTVKSQSTSGAETEVKSKKVYYPLSIVKADLLDLE